jgi:chromosomal replication initiator protein
LAVAAGQAIAQDPGTVYNPFFVYGDVGLGKTHIMQAIANSLVQHDPNKVIVYLPTTKFLDHIISAIKR